MIPVEVKLWGTTIGALSQKNDNFASFEYNPDFVRSGIEPAPITMPVRAGVIYRFPNLSSATFHKLPGLFSPVLLQALLHCGIPLLFYLFG